MNRKFQNYIKTLTIDLLKKPSKIVYITIHSSQDTDKA